MAHMQHFLGWGKSRANYLRMLHTLMRRIVHTVSETGLVIQRNSSRDPDAQHSSSASLLMHHLHIILSSSNAAAPLHSLC
eukprot:scaffold4463_cov51-Attheya_sp.AAC.21